MGRLTRIEWLLVVIVAAILAHAALPRYEWHVPSALNPRIGIRADRWTGRAQYGSFAGDGAWHPIVTTLIGEAVDIAPAPSSAK